MKSLALVVMVSACTYPALDEATCPEESSYSAILAGENQQVAFNEGSGASWSQELKFDGVLSSAPEIDLFVFIFGGGGNASTPDWPSTLGPGTVELDGTSGLDAFAQIDTNFTGPGGVAVDEFLAVSGTLDVTTADGQTFSGTLSNVTFAQGSSDSNGNFQVTPEGCATTFSGSFSGAIQ